MNQDFRIKTDRTIIRQWTDRDIYSYADMNADVEVMRYFPRVLSFDESQESLRVLNEHIEQHGYGIWCLSDATTNECIGSLGLTHPRFEEWFTPCVEIGWRLRKEYWNRGIATEAARAVLDYGFDGLGLDKIYSFTAVVNKASERVMQKIGMSRIGEFEHPRVEVGHVLRPHVLYCVERSRVEI